MTLPLWVMAACPETTCPFVGRVLEAKPAALTYARPNKADEVRTNMLLRMIFKATKFLFSLYLEKEKKPKE